MTFLIPLSKEIKEQLRTYRFLIVAAVFVFFGLLSPLLAKMTPELLKGLETSGISVQLPPPTTTDALVQYLKNLTQFGVLLAILLVMGCVAQEKERGTASMILSKPLSRLSFLAAKFASLSLSFLVSLALAGIACYYYTIILFGRLDGLLFVKINLLLGLWLLVYIAITLFFSTLAGSQVVAGGLAFAVLIVLSILSGIPRLGRYLPGELLSWANRVTAGAPGDAWWAVVVSLGIILACFTAAWQIFERQEL